MVIRPDSKSDAVSTMQDVMSGNRPPDAIDPLIDVWFQESQLRLRDLKCQIAVRGDSESIEIPELDPELPRVGSWGNNKVVLQLTLIAVVDEVDPGIHTAVLHARKMRYAGPPPGRVVSHQVVAVSGLRIESLALSVRVAADEFHGRRSRAQTKSGFGAFQ